MWTKFETGSFLREKPQRIWHVRMDRFGQKGNRGQGTLRWRAAWATPHGFRVWCHRRLNVVTRILKPGLAPCG
jgi:hypothetical protein